MSMRSDRYPSDPQHEVHCRAETLRPMLAQMLKRSSLFPYDVAVVVDRILETELYGIPSHGLIRFCRLLEAIDLGDVDPRGQVLTLTQGDGFAVLDGSRAIGHVAATKGAELASSKAKTTGVAAVAIGNSQTLGAAEVYVRLMAQAGVIGICTTNTGRASVAAPNSTAGAVGNCAFAYAVPVDGNSPLVFDTACGAESWGKLELLQRYGIPLPGSLAFTADGGAAFSLADAMSLLPAGGAMGFGLSILCSVLAGLLAGGRMPIHKTRRNSANDSEHFFLAIDPMKFCDPENFQQELQTTLDEIRALPRTDPDNPVRIPGDRGALSFEKYSQEGIPVHRSIVEELRMKAEQMKLAHPFESPSNQD